MLHRSIVATATLALLLGGGPGCADDGGGGPADDPGPYTLDSPDGLLHVTVERQDLAGTADYPDGEAWYYRVERNGTAVLDWSPLGLHLEGTDLVTDLRTVDVTRREVTQTYTTVVGKRLDRQVHGNEMTLALEGPGGTPLSVVFRAHDDGVAFRYVVGGDGSATMQGEATGFAVPAGSTAWMASYDESSLGLFRGAYENPYERRAAGTAAPNVQGFQFPALFRAGSGGDTYALLTESDLDGTYCGSRLGATPEGNVYRIALPMAADGNGVGDANPTSTRPWTLPWRVVLVGDPAGIVESTLADDLARPAELTDTSWIVPGPVAWSWLTQGTGDEALQREYVQLAQEMGWKHVLIDAHWDEWTDVDTAMPALVADAASAGVGVILWYNSGGNHNLNRGETPVDRMLDPAVREAEMQKLEDWGVAGIKVDFFMSDKQDRIQQYIGILRDAAAHHLMVNFHGATIPRGWQRTYPNLMTVEAVRGAEYTSFGLLPDAVHRIRYVLIRNVVGSMDYTPLDFEDSLADQGIPYAGELALAVAFESSWQDFSGNGDLDTSTGYRALFAAFPFVQAFLEDFPTVWDETRLIDADPDSHAIVARRSGSRWYVAGLWGGDAATTMSVPLSFLDAGDHTVTVIHEGATPDQLVQDTQTLTAADTLDVSVGPSGGFTAFVD